MLKFKININKKIYNNLIYINKIQKLIILQNFIIQVYKKIIMEFFFKINFNNILFLKII